MATITEKQLQAIEVALPELGAEIRMDNYLKTIKGNPVEVEIQCGEYSDEHSKTLTVHGEQLHKYWAITPEMDALGNQAKMKRCLTHIPSGLKAATFKSRRIVLQLWEEIKELPLIEIEDPKDMDTDNGLDTFKEKVFEYENK